MKEKKKEIALASIAKPLAGKKLCKSTLKLVRRASESKCLKRGVKEVFKSIRRGHKGDIMVDLFSCVKEDLIKGTAMKLKLLRSRKKIIMSSVLGTKPKWVMEEMCEVIGVQGGVRLCQLFCRL